MAFLIEQFTGGLELYRTRWSLLGEDIATKLRAAFSRVECAGVGGALAAGRGRIATDPGQILRRLSQGRRTGLLGRAGLMAVVGGGLLWAALSCAEVLLALRHSDATAVVATAAPQAWFEVNRPIPIYDLGGTDFAKLPRTYQARRHVPDGTREDVMSFGTLGDGKPYLRIALTRRGDGAAEAESAALVDALARLAGTAGQTVSRIRPLPPIETRFGALERADLMLWQGGTATECRGFRGLPNGGAVLTLMGFACRAADRPLADQSVACAVDRIDLLSAGDDRPLRTLFVTAERRPGAAACGEGVLASSIAPAPAPGPFAALRRRAAWLEAGAEGLPLRGGFDAAHAEP